MSDGVLMFFARLMICAKHHPVNFTLQLPMPRCMWREPHLHQARHSQRDILCRHSSKVECVQRHLCGRLPN